VDFLNVGPWELVVVLIIAILVAGPERMVEIARSLGRVSRQLRSLSREFTTALQAEIQAAEKEAQESVPGLGEARQDLEDALSGAPQLTSEADEPDEGEDE
jgi:Tat protein translocase TatB subunit